ncbi:hypothetical protein BD779DRAFT_1678771 [Infundibulicybe gibba]|nr:hypothetical protein BD779DRAFT_1678771 [Infundibulicybe gibba]
MPRSGSPNDVEDSVHADSSPRRTRNKSRRARDAISNAMEERANKEARQARTMQRAQIRAQNRTAATTVEQAGDSDEVQQLKALLHTAQAERAAAEQELSTIQAQLERHDASTSSVDDGSIPRPSRINSVTIALLRQHMDLEGPEHKIEWDRMRSVIRDFLRAGRVEWTLRWKDQPARRLAKIYDAIEDELPVLRRFRGSWATEYLSRSAFSNHKTYETCKDDGLKYRGKTKRIYRAAVALRKRHARSSVVSSDSSDSEIDGDSLE